MATRKSTTPDPATAAADDTKLITLCCHINADYTAFKASFQPDPDGNAKNAEAVAERYLAQAQGGVKKIIKVQPQTLAGLSAKAVACAAVMKDESGCHLSDMAEALIRSLVADVIRIAQLNGSSAGQQ